MRKFLNRMSNFIVLFMMALFLPVMLLAQDGEPGEPVDIWVTVIAVLVILQEVVLRIWPNKNYNGLIGIIVNAIKWISDFLNRDKKT